MSISPELHAALTRISDDLNHLRTSIRTLLGDMAEAGRAGGSAAGTELAQYRLLEEAIRHPASAGDEGDAAAQPPQASAPKRSARQAAGDRGPGAMPEVPLGTTGWVLRDGGCALDAPDGAGRIPLNAEERALLMHIACAPGHRMSLNEVQDLVGVPKALRHSDNERAMRHLYVVSRLQARLRFMGYRLPLRVIRGWGYALAEKQCASPRHDRPAELRSTPASTAARHHPVAVRAS